MVKAIVGYLLLAATVVLLGQAMLLFRRPNGPWWRDHFLVGEGGALLLTIMFASGVALLMEFSLQFEAARMKALAGGLSLVGVAVLSAAIWWAMGVKRRAAAYERAPAPTAEVPVTAPGGAKPDGPSSPGVNPTGSAGRRNRAA